MEIPILKTLIDDYTGFAVGDKVYFKKQMDAPLGSDYMFLRPNKDAALITKLNPLTVRPDRWGNMEIEVQPEEIELVADVERRRQAKAEGQDKEHSIETFILNMEKSLKSANERAERLERENAKLTEQIASLTSVNMVAFKPYKVDGLPAQGGVVGAGDLERMLNAGARDGWHSPRFLQQQDGSINIVWTNGALEADELPTDSKMLYIDGDEAANKMAVQGWLDDVHTRNREIVAKPVRERMQRRTNRKTFRGGIN